MRTFFTSQGLWEIVNDGRQNPQDTSTLLVVEKEKLNKDIEMDSLALYHIQMAVEDSIFPRISGATILSRLGEFQGSAKVCIVKLQTFGRDLENAKMKDSKTIKEYYSRLREIVNQLRAYGDDIPKKRVVEKLLISLPEKCDPIITTIEEIKDITTFPMTELVGSLEAYAKR
ncbi:hypothetical protein Pint_36054 [Pistacia integerrima]|uniref:Uncharacterized protein n=1 Tax=Pistacia integerrima TaxID=434235 RepID=A0ACC0Y008_9ROSI|nr:hypothetical protein Pint_36054 [Pistacia integerrima]